jgi:hypothetical protein
MMPFLRRAISPRTASLYTHIQTARCDQFIGAVPAIEFADSKCRAIDGRRRTDDGNTRAIRQACVKDGILTGQILAENSRHALDGGLEAVVAVRRGERNMLHHAAAIRKDSGRPINHQV